MTIETTQSRSNLTYHPVYGKYLFVWPVTSQININDYFIKYLEISQNFLESLSGEAATDLERPLIAIPKEYYATLSNDAAENLRRRETLTYKAFERRFPLLDGELLIEELATGLLQDWRGFKAGTFVYSRKTNFAELFFIFPHVSIHEETGIIITSAHVISSPGIHLAAVDHNQAAITVIDCALTFTELACFAIPVAGVFVSGAVSVIHTVFSEYIAPTLLPLSPKKSVADSLQDILNRHDIDLSFNTFITYYNWFHDHYEIEKNKQIVEESEDYHKQFKETLSRSLDPNFGLQNSLTLLQNPSHDIWGLNVFMFGASFDLTLRKVAILVDSFVQRRLDSIEFPIMLERYKQYIEHANATIQKIEDIIENRLDQVSGTYHFGSSTCFGAGCAAGTGWRFDDEAAGILDREHRYYDTDTCKGSKETALVRAEKGREQYLNKLRASMVKTYYHNQKEKYITIIEEWTNSYRERKSQWEEHIANNEK